MSSNKIRSDRIEKNHTPLSCSPIIILGNLTLSAQRIALKDNENTLIEPVVVVYSG